MNEDNQDTIWGLADYAIYVPMSDDFYKTLKFQKVTLEKFLSGDYQHQPIYKDSRTYMRPLLEHFIEYCMPPFIFDVGGYIGRFSIEASLLNEELSTDCSITCYEPGDTYSMLLRNIRLNKAARDILCINNAVSNHTRLARFAVANNAKISSRIIGEGVDIKATFGQNWSEKIVNTIMLQDFLSAKSDDLNHPFICKIDTEGHEVKVIEGIGMNNLATRPHVLIIEFWPSLLKETMGGVSFEKYALENYYIYDIRNSLYPLGYKRLEDFKEPVRKINSREANNLDLLMLHKSIPEFERLTQAISIL